MIMNKKPQITAYPDLRESNVPEGLSLFFHDQGTASINGYQNAVFVACTM